MVKKVQQSVDINWYFFRCWGIVIHTGCRLSAMRFSQARLWNRANCSFELTQRGQNPWS